MFKLAKLDMFNYTPGLKYNEGKGFSTMAGTLISIGFYILIITIFIFQVIQLLNWNYSSKDFFQTFEYGEDNFLELNKMTFVLSLRLYIHKGNETRKEYIGFEAFQFLNSEVFIPDSQNSLVKNNISFVPCKETLIGNHYEEDISNDFLSYLNFRNYSLNRCVCMKFDKEYKIYKGINSGKSHTKYNGFKLIINHKKAKVDEKFILLSEVFFYSNPYKIEASNPSKSKSSNKDRIIVSEHLISGPNLKIPDVHIKYRKINYTLDTNLLVEDKKIYKHFIITSYERPEQEREDRYKNRAISIEINIESTVDHIFVRYSKLTDLFSYLGGLWKFISLPIKLVKILYKKLIRDELLQDLKELEENDFKDLTCCEVNSNDYTEKPSKFYDYKGDDYIEENRNRPINESYKTNSISDSICNKENLLKDVLITTIEAHEDIIEPNLEEVSLNWWKQTCYTFCKCCCRNEKIEKILQRQKVLMKKLNHLLDVKTILRVMHTSCKKS